MIQAAVEALALDFLLAAIQLDIKRIKHAHQGAPQSEWSGCHCFGKRVLASCQRHRANASKSRLRNMNAGGLGVCRQMPLEDNFHIGIQGVEAAVKMVEGKTGQPAIGQIGNIRLRQVQKFGGFPLLKPAFLDLLIDKTGQLRLGNAFVAIRQPGKGMLGGGHAVSVQSIGHGVLSPSSG
jgi:hypothetical protein